MHSQFKEFLTPLWTGSHCPLNGTHGAILAFFGAILIASAAEAAGSNSLFWSFKPLNHPQIPFSKNAPKGWSSNPIDAFILAGLEKRNLAPAAPANKPALLRRACFDLTGLPPTPEQIVEFQRDNRPHAYSDLVERLLASPQYGERWARHWLDLARYADTGGFEKDLPYPNAWQFRDFVIRSFNANKSFDRFIQEQIAGDELWPDDTNAVVATSLFAIGPVSQDSALNTNQLEYEWLTDAADTTGAAFLGLTVGCARCHNHKYDPITQSDYFAMQAIFAASDRPYPPPIREHRIKGLNGILADVPIPKELLSDPRCTIKTDDKAPERLFHRDTPLEIRRLKRGELSKPQEEVAPALPAVFAVDKKSFDPASTSADRRRVVLAKWLVSPNNPLTARVIVNRIWNWHFGLGLVRTPNDFGSQGEPPTHPELLDWLASDFISHGWDLKRLHRVIMSSATYQMRSAGADKRALETDPENRLLSHFPRNRLDSEALWDGLHAVAGTLNLKQFGPPVTPALSKDELSGLFEEKSWKVSKDESEFNRRGVYLYERRTFLVPMLDAFDPPDVMSSCPRRFETTVPTQALALLNSAVAQKQAQAFARRVHSECGGELEKIPARAWLLAFGRPISKSENEHVMEFLRKREAHKSGDSADPSVRTADAVVSSETPSVPPGPVLETWLETALTELCLSLFNANEFVFID
jgi:hypothetical protein